MKSKVVRYACLEELQHFIIKLNSGKSRIGLQKKNAGHELYVQTTMPRARYT